MENEKIFRKEFYLNEYELKEKRLSLTNFLLYYDIDFILNNDIINHFELDMINYTNLLVDLEKDLTIEDYFIFIQKNINENDFKEYLNENINIDFDLLNENQLNDLINNYDFDLKEFINDFENDIKCYYDIENPYELDIFQYYIIKENDKELFEKYTDYPIFYCNELDLYLIGITHYNISFTLVFTQKTFTDLYIIDKSTNKKVYFNGIANYSFKW